MLSFHILNYIHIFLRITLNPASSKMGKGDRRNNGDEILRLSVLHFMPRFQGIGSQRRGFLVARAKN